VSATVLCATSFSKPWDPNHSIAKAFERKGLRVARIDPATSPDAQGEFAAALERERPRMVFITKGDRMEPSWLEEARRKGAFVVVWYPDSVPVGKALPLARACDHFFTMARGRLPEYRAAGVERVSWLSEGFDPEHHAGWEDLPREFYGSDVTFVGNLGRKPHYMPRRYYLGAVAGRGQNFKWWGPPPSRSFRDLPARLGWLGRTWGGEAVYKQSYAAVAAYSGVFLAIDAYPEIELSVSVRTYTATGCGAFYLCLHVEGIEELFVPGEEIETFRDREELLDKVRFFLANEDARRRIAKAGQRRTISSYTYDHRVNELLRVLREEDGFTP